MDTHAPGDQRPNNSPAPTAAPAAASLTHLIDSASAGDRTACASLFNQVYGELRMIAQGQMNEERSGHTLQPTALINEAFVRLLGHDSARFENRRHFFAAAAEAMRRVLIDHARSRNADKRGGGLAALALSTAADVAASENPAGLLSLDDALLRMEQVDEQAATVVRLRFYAGLSEASVADALGVSTRTVRRDWAFARAWLRDALEAESEGKTNAP